VLTSVQIRALVQGIVLSNSATKQELGQRFASFLGLQPGPRGPDDGIDGWLERNGKKIHFQCKLSAKELGKVEAHKYYAELRHLQPDVTIMLAGVGYKKTFVDRLFSYSDVKREQTHLLTLRDLFAENADYQRALNELPLLAGLAKVAMSQVKQDP
jgi:hypothetical protein